MHDTGNAPSAWILYKLRYRLVIKESRLSIRLLCALFWPPIRRVSLQEASGWNLRIKSKRWKRRVDEGANSHQNLPALAICNMRHCASRTSLLAAIMGAPGRMLRQERPFFHCAESECGRMMDCTTTWQLADEGRIGHDDSWFKAARQLVLPGLTNGHMSRVLYLQPVCSGDCPPYKDIQ